MMAELGVLDASRFAAYASPASTDYGVTVTASATPHAKGTWRELVASTAFDAAGFLFMGARNSTAGDNFLVDLGIGASGSERVLVGDILVGCGGGGRDFSQFYCPIPIPAASRLSARIQCSAASKTLMLGLLVLGAVPALWPRLARTITYGAVAGTSRGTQLDPGGTANTKGAWTEIAAALTNPVKWLIGCVSRQGDATAATAFFRLDIAVGAAGVERVVVPDMLFYIAASSDELMPRFFALPCALASGLRLAARCQSDQGAAGDRELDLVLIGVD
jgi:hypothetical protein